MCKALSGIDLETGKRFLENFNNLMDVKKLGRREDAVSLCWYDEGRTIQVLAHNPMRRSLLKDLSS